MRSAPEPQRGVRLDPLHRAPGRSGYRAVRRQRGRHSYDNALAETVIGLFKTEVIYRQTWRCREDVEWAVADWVQWYNNEATAGPDRLHSPGGSRGGVLRRNQWLRQSGVTQ